MKIALINPPIPFFKGDGSENLQPYLPLAITHLNGFLKKNGIETEVIDLNVTLMENKRLFDSFNNIDTRLTLDQFFKKNEYLIKKVVDYFISKIAISDCNALGISILEGQSLKISLPLLKEIKKLYPHIKIVVGGEPHLIEKENIADFLVFGMGEMSLLSIMNGLQNNESLPKIFTNDDNNKINFSEQITSFEKNQIDIYRFLQEDYNIFNDIFCAPLLPYMIGKGCQFRCSFCSISAKTLTYKTPEQIVKDIKRIKNKFNYNYFYFLHEHLTISKAFVQELCDRIIDSKLDILWSDCIKPMGYLTQKDYIKLRESGCIKLSYGIESGNEKIAKLMDKGHNIEDSVKNLKYANKAGIITEAGFIVGFPQEGNEEFNETLDFVVKNKENLDLIGGSIYRLHNEALMAHDLEKFGIKIRKEDENTRFVKCEVYEYDEINGLKFEELQKIHRFRLNKLFDTFQSNKRNIDYFSLKNLSFPLYDTLGSKHKVMEFLTDNFDILSRPNKKYHSLFLGALSNQKLKGNLHLCSLEDFKSVNFNKLLERMNEIHSTGFNKLIIFGGEPLIHPNIIEILSKAKEIGFEHIIIKTNARMLSYFDYCRKISKYVDEILVISPSNVEEEYEKISGVKGSYSQAKEGIENWKKLNKAMRYYSR
jgi:MoaA/NifB/PqqE/SkfB family radical SAM enzyme